MGLPSAWIAVCRRRCPDNRERMPPLFYRLVCRLRNGTVCVTGALAYLALWGCGGGSTGSNIQLAAAPSFSPSAGSYSASQMVKISDITPGVTIYYTTDGTVPTPSSAIYSGP